VKITNARFKHKTVAVLMGGVSAERKISLRSGANVLAALRRAGVKAFGADIRGWKDLVALERRRPDAALLVLHGTGGEDGAIQGALEWMRIPYAGSGVLASALAMDKARSKELFRELGLPTAPWALLTSPQAPVPKTPGLPLVVKPNRQGSTVGISIVRRPAELKPAIREAFRHDSQVLLEKFCPGMEITVGVLGDETLPVIEIVPKREFYDFKAKYEPGMSEHIIPARLPGAVQARARKLALAAHRALDCRGVSRTDFIVAANGCMNILEVNTLPGMTATSLLPDAARTAGISLEELVLRLAADALEPRA
jgi:D-alanine-D-alanine ligase